SIITRALSRISSLAFACSTPYETTPVTSSPNAKTAASARLNFHISFMTSPSFACRTCRRLFLAVAKGPLEDRRPFLRFLWRLGLGLFRLRFFSFELVLGRTFRRRRKRCLPFRIRLRLGHRRRAKVRVGEPRLQTSDEELSVRTRQPWLGLRVTDRSIARKLHPHDRILRSSRGQRIPEMTRQRGDKFL